MFSEDLQKFPEDLQLKTNLGQGLRALIKSSATCHISQPEKSLQKLSRKNHQATCNPQKPSERK
jgi:hypothetical protein